MSKTTTTLEQLRDQPDEELRQQLARTRDELFRLHLGQHTNQVTSTAALQSKRRDIARIMTILRGRSLSIETQAQKSAAPASDDAPAATKTKKAAAPKTAKAKKAKS
ncbi:MAG: 50S ribosomal protein L29 [Kofleriaceae bacterium]